MEELYEKIANKTFRVSNKQNRLAQISRFFKETGYWPFFRKRILYPQYFLNQNEEMYDGLYDSKSFENGIEAFEKKLKKDRRGLLSSRQMLVFEYEELIPDDVSLSEDICSLLDRRYKDLIDEGKMP